MPFSLITCLKERVDNADPIYHRFEISRDWHDVDMFYCLVNRGFDLIQWADKIHSRTLRGQLSNCHSFSSLNILRNDQGYDGCCPETRIQKYLVFLLKRQWRWRWLVVVVGGGGGVGGVDGDGDDDKRYPKSILMKSFEFGRVFLWTSFSVSQWQIHIG